MSNMQNRTPENCKIRGDSVEHQFKGLVETGLDEGKEKLYYSEKLLCKISKYLQKEPLVLRSAEVQEEGWFNKKESYVRKRLKHKRAEGKYYLAMGSVYRSYMGQRMTRYILYWLNERDVFYINQNLDYEPEGEPVRIADLKEQYHLINVDDTGKG